ncbi:hypothetical protein PENSPDRAFT_451378 [Peniophora sp. CONT]|nr:hypothetical protein PENSPDRAFT_451378 [Peniophora sp. CONT]
MAVHPTADVKTNLGAILLGALISMALSGVVATQVFFYFRVYGKDKHSMKFLVLLVWIMDATHSGLISAAVWKYFALAYGDATQLDFITPEVALTVAFTALITFVVHMFFSYRVYKLSKSNWWCTGPILMLALGRLVAAIVSTYEMGTLKSYSGFVVKAGWVFTLGLSLSSALDILIAGAMCYYLQASRTGFEGMDHIIDVLLLYTFNNGALTSIVTVATLICWVAMQDNLVFFGIHFSIAKLYGISLLITLNTRISIRERATRSDGSSHQLPVRFPSSLTGRRTRSVVTRFPTTQSRSGIEPTSTKISINVEKTIHFDVDTVDGVELSNTAESGERRPSSSGADKSPTSASPLEYPDSPLEYQR